MRITKRTLGVGLLVAAVVAAGSVTATIALGDDPPATATFKTVDGANQFSLVSGSGSATSASIVTGGTVTFTNASAEMHDVDVVAQPGVSCQQTVGGTSSSTVRFPSAPASGTWAGTCTFTKAGTYSFVCDVHEGMAGTVVVSDAGAAPPVAPVVTAPTPIDPAPVAVTPIPPVVTPTPVVTPSVPAPAVAQTPVAVVRTLAFKVGLTQRGTSVRGTISGARSAGRVKVVLTARRGDVGLKGKAAARVRIGTLSASTSQIGALAFVVKLNSTGRAALAKHHRLALTVAVTAPPVSGAATLKTFKILVRP